MREDCCVLVLGGHRQSLAVVRGLVASNAARIVFGYPDTWTGPGYVGHSRWVDELWQHPPLDRERPFVDALRVFLDSHPNVRFVFPVGDTEIRAFERMRRRLPRQVRYLMASTDVLQTCRRKAALFAISRELGIPTAEYRLARTGPALLNAADAVGYPCIVKAESEELRAFGRKAFIVAKRAELQEALELQLRPQALLVQSYVTGARHNLYFFAEAGVVRAVAQVRIIRTDRPDGTGYAVEGITVPTDVQWRDHLQRLASHMGYDGPGCLQFIHDGTSRSTILELNPRLGANYAIVEKAGLHLPRWWLEHLESGRASIPATLECESGLRYGWFYGDLAGWLSSFRDPGTTVRERCVWGASLIRSLTAPNHVVWDWRDPSPPLHLYAQLLKPHRMGGAENRVARSSAS